MTFRQREIYRLEHEIARLQKKLDILKAMKDNSLCLGENNFFEPAYKLRLAVGNKRFEVLGLKFKTTDELLNATPNDVLMLKGWGKASLKKLEEWMIETGLKFN